MTLPLDRRQWLASTAGTAAGLLIPEISRAATAGAPAGPSIYELETGQQVDRGGPVARLRDGRLLWVTIEPEAPYLSPHVWPLARLVARESRDGGRSWVNPRVLVRGTKDYSVLSHVLLELRSGDLIHVYVRYGGYDHATSDPAKSLNQAFLERSSDGGATWSAPRLLPTGERYVSDVLSIVELSTGRILYPYGFLTAQRGRFKVSVLRSDDSARTWRRSTSPLDVGGSGFESGATEPSIVELPGGRLWILIRAQTGFLWESFSTDGGETWEAARPARLPSSNAPATALRLSTGKIAVVWNNHVSSAYARQSLVVALTDDGKTFTGCREFDHTDFPNDDRQPPAHVTYPFLAEAPDGALLVSYNKGHWLRHNRARLARIDPRWVAAEREVEDFRGGRAGWCSRDPGPNAVAADERYAAPEDAAPGAALEIAEPQGAASPCGITRNVPLLARGEMVVTLTVVSPQAALLWHDSMLAPGAWDRACLRVRFAPGGHVHVGAGTPERTDRERRGLAYSFLDYPIRAEEAYPRPVTPGKRLELRLRVDALARRAFVRIDDGPELPVALGDILGLAYFGLAVRGGGILKIRRFESVRR